MLGPALHLGRNASLRQVVAQLLAERGHLLLAFDAALIEQCRHRLVVLGLQKAERQVFHFPFDLPNTEPVGQRREHLHRLGRQVWGNRGLAGGVMAQRLQPRGQAQQHHPQVAGERQQHLAHPLGLLGALVGAHLGAPRGTLNLHQAAGVRHQPGIRVAEGLGHHFFWLGEVVAGVHQVGGGAHGG